MSNTQVLLKAVSVTKLTDAGSATGILSDVAATEQPLITAYESHPITAPLSRGVPSAFPVTRSFDVTSGAKGTATKLFGTGDVVPPTDRFALDSA